MRRAIFIVRASLGQLTPSVAIAKELAERGVEVRFATHPMMADYVRQAGLPFEPSAVSLVRFTDPERFDSMPEEIRYELRELMQTYEEANRWLDEEDDLLVVVDSTLPGPAYAAEKRNVPWVSIGMAAHVHLDEVYGDPRSYSMIQKYMMRSLNHARKQMGLPALIDPLRAKPEYFGWSPWLHLSTSLRELEYDMSVFPEGTMFVGPSHLLEPQQDVEFGELVEFLNREDHRPVVLVSTPSEDKPFFRGNSETYVNAMVNGFADRPYRVVFTCSPHLTIQPGWRSLENMRFVVTAASVHAKLFPSVDYLVFHGGYGTFHRALRHGVPMVIVPNGFDAYAVAKRCELLGLGKKVEAREVTPDVLVDAIESLHRDERYAQAVRSFRHLLADHDANRTAADAILELAGRRACT